MKKSRVTTLLLTGVLLVASLGGGSIGIHAESKTTPIQTSPTYKSSALNKEMEFKDLLKEFTFLTEKEKQSLLASEGKVKDRYQRLDEIDKQINAIYDDVLKKAGNPDKKIDDITKRNKALWDKLYKQVNKEQDKAQDMQEFIKKSSVLTKKEKDTLIQDELLIKKVQAEIDKLYKDAQKLIKPLDDEALTIEAEIKKIDKQNKDIWDKIFLHPSDNNSPIVYDRMLK